MPLGGECGICVGNPERRRLVNQALIIKTPHTRIEAAMKSRGMPVKRETIRKHLRVCVAGGVHEMEVQRAGPKQSARRHSASLSEVRVTKSVAPSGPLVNLPATDDFATLVKAAAVEKLRSGELRITTQDGLQAQGLLDRREEKKKDRDLFVQIGRLLAGQGGATPPIVIEGTFENIEEVGEEPRLLHVGPE